MSHPKEIKKEEGGIASSNSQEKDGALEKRPSVGALVGAMIIILLLLGSIEVLVYRGTSSNPFFSQGVSHIIQSFITR